MSKSICVVPIPGRDYASKKQALDAWFAGKDFIFITENGRPNQWANKPCSTRDFAPDDEIHIRYKRIQRKVITLNQQDR